VNVFERLGVGVEASADDVEAAWQELLVQNKFDRNSIPEDVQVIYRFLKLGENRRLYRILLLACESEDPLAMEADRVPALRRVCQRTGLRLFDDPERDNVFHLRRPDQPEPRLPTPPPKVLQPEAPPTAVERFREFMMTISLLRALRNGTFLKRLVVLAVYAAVVVGFGKGITSFNAWRSARLAQAMESDDSRAARMKAEREQSLRTEHATALVGFDALGTAGAHVASEFHKTTGIEWTHAHDRNVTRTRELDLVLLRNPSVRDAWDAVLASLAPLTDVATNRGALDGIKQHFDAGNFTDADVERLRIIAAWSASHTQNLLSQSSNLEHLRVMLAAERFEQHSESLERSEP